MPGCPIRESPGPSLLAANRSSFVACYALHRLSVPRHPPCALCSLITQRDVSTRCLRFAMQLSRCACDARWSQIPEDLPSDHCSSPDPRMISNALKAGGDDRARTGDLLRAREALSQLSYVPGPVPSFLQWWAIVDLNYGPRPYQGRALTN